MTNVEKVELLIGNSSLTPPFEDDEIQAFLDMSNDANLGGGENIFLAAAYACDVLSARTVVGAGAFAATGLSLGDYSTSTGSTSGTYSKQAQAWRDLVNNTPAFGVAEINTNTFAALQILRNNILRTEP
jgi:hypothetical protein